MTKVFLTALLVVFGAVSASAQAITGTILGTVADSSGAVLPGVTINATNTGTNQLRTTITNESGGYSLPSLQIGSYRVEAELAGFKKEIRSGITLQLDQRARIDFVMQVGQVSDALEVVAEAPLVQTDDSSIGAVIDYKKVVELPLNGRQFESLVQLVPGAVTPAQGSHLGNRGGFNVAGMDEHYNSFFLDGIDNVDPIIRNFSFRPSVDLIEEFKVQESGYNAEFGRNAGAVINVTTKSGTNAFHGSAWEFIRNDHLDARNFFAPVGTPKPPLIRNQFGAVLGGRIVKDKTFFFAAYEGGRSKIGTTRRASVPTDAERAGILRSAAIDPQTGQPFPNNTIPLNRFDPISVAVLNQWPPANLTTTGGNRAETANRIENINDISLKIDHQLLESSRLTGRYSYSVARVLDAFRNETGGGANLGAFGQIADRIRTNIGLSLTTVKGGKWVNELRVGYNRFNQPQIPVNNGPPEIVPLQGFIKSFVPFTVAGYDTIGSSGEFKRVVNVYNYIDNLSYSVGNHQFKWGADIRRYLFNAYTISLNALNFDGSRTSGAGVTGNPFADFLLGLPFRTTSVTSGEGQGFPGGNPRKLEVALYLQDDWKINPRLTLNYGVRWEFYKRIVEKRNRQSSWSATCNCVLVAGNGIDPALTSEDYNNVAPRFGFALRPFRNDKTVVRGSTGIFYDSDMRHNFEVINNPPFLIQRTFTSSQIPGGLSLSNPFPAGSGTATLNPQAFPAEYRDTYSEHFNFGIQHELVQGMLLDVSYVGNHTLKGRRTRNVNQPINGVRPYAGFGNIVLNEQAGSSVYSSLQTRVEQRFSSGLTFIGSYTWGHAIDNRPGQGTASTVQNNYDFRSERGDADFDVRHRMTISSVFEIPVGRGRKHGDQWNRALDAVLGGWGINGIGTFQGGRPFTVSLSTNPSGSLAGAGADRPNLVPGASAVPSNQGPDNWINRDAFTLPAPNTFGNAGRNIARGPTYKNVDFSLSKKFDIAENRRLQFRAEFFNIANHPNFALPNAQWASSVAGAPNFGRITQTIGSERQVQFGLRFEY
jgi:hypothetical protein